MCKHETVAGELLYGVRNNWQVIEDSGGEDVFSDFQPIDLSKAIQDELPPQSKFASKPALENPVSTGRNNAPPDVAENGDVSDHSINGLSAYAAASNTSGEYQLADETSQTDYVDSRKPQDPKRLDWQKFQPVSHEEFQRSRRKDRSPLRPIIQVVLGGLLAIPIAILIIWYGLGTDPFDLGPSVAQVAPWAVPQEFRGQLDNQEVRVDRNRNRNRFENDASLGRRSTLPELDFDGQDDPVGRSSADSDRTILEGAMSNSTRDYADSDDFASASLPPTPGVQLKNAPNDLERDTSSARAESESSSRLYSKSILDLRNSIDEWNNYEGNETSERKRMAQTFYANLCRVAQRQPDRSSTNEKTVWLQMQSDLLRQIADDSMLRSIADRGSVFFVKENQLSSGDGFACLISITQPSDPMEDVTVRNDSLPTLEFQPSPAVARRGMLPGEYLALGSIRPRETNGEIDTFTTSDPVSPATDGESARNDTSDSDVQSDADVSRNRMIEIVDLVPLPLDD
jgi:hypothetical protein